MSEWQIERLSRSHDRSGFSCGKPSLDEFIRRFVTQYEKRNLGRTFVAVRKGETLIGGYYTLASSSVSFEHLPEESARKLAKHPVPVVLIARLAVDTSEQGQKLGEKLLIDALSRCLGLADELGVHAVEVDAIDEQARSFYLKYGFVSLRDDPRHLFLPVNTIRDALDSSRLQ